MTLRDTESDEERRGGADALRAGPPGPASAEPGGSAAGQGTRPTNDVFNRAVAGWSNTAAPQNWQSPPGTSAYSSA